MNCSIWLFVLCLSVGLVAGKQVAVREDQPELAPYYSVRFNISTGGYEPQWAMEYYDYINDKQRFDMTLGDTQSSRLLRWQEGKQYEFSNATKSCTVSATTGKQQPPDFLREEHAKYIGVAVVRGVQCYEWAYEEGSFKIRMYTSYETAEVAPMRMIRQGPTSTTTCEYFNYQPGPQDPSLFEIPSYC